MIQEPAPTRSVAPKSRESEISQPLHDSPRIATELPVPTQEPGVTGICDLKTILVPTDFSAPAEKALLYAAALARQFQARLVLMHAVEPLYALDSYMGYVDTVDTTGISERLKDLTRTLSCSGLQTGEPILVSGVGWDSIVRTAANIKADLIIIATHGYTGLTHVLLGSTAERVVRHAGCPVLVVREREREFVN